MPAPPRPSERWERGAVIAWIAAWWVWLFWSCAADWQVEGFEFGWVVPPLALYFLFRRWEEHPSESGHERFPALVLIGGLCVAALAAGPIEIVRLAPVPWRLVLWAIYGLAVAVSLLAVRLWWPGRTRSILVPMLFAGLALPWPTVVELFLTNDLARGLAAVASEILRWTGVPAVPSGKTIVLSSCTVGIEEACSGVRSLQSALILAVGIGELRRMGVGSRFALMVLASLVALAENFLRLLVLSFLASRGGAALLDQWHDTAGWVGLATLAGGTWWCARLLAPLEGASSSTEKEFSGDVPSVGRSVLVVGLALSLGGFLLAHAWYLPTTTAARPSLTVREEGVTLEKAPDGILAVLQPASGGYLVQRGSAVGTFSGYHFYWEPSRRAPLQLFHRPDVCMPGAGWTLIGHPEKVDISVGGELTTWWQFLFEREGVRVSLLWTSFIDGRNFSVPLEQGISNVQTAFLGEFIRRRISAPSYEVAAILSSPPIPLHEESAAAAINRVFARSPGS